MAVDSKRAQAVFLAAVQAADAAEQAAMLDRECAADPELRRCVEALLDAHRQPASILDRPAVAPPSAILETGLFAGAAEPCRLGFLEPPTQPGALGRIGHYEVLEVLGRGGFGIVLRAFDEVLRRVVALKVLAPEIAATSPARKRFLREARAAAQVRHENVVQIYAVHDQPLPFLVMEFIPGETLQQLLDRTGPLDATEVLAIGRQIGEGLAAAHANDVIHRDVKPGNVLIEGGPQRRVKLTDFGLARTADDASITQSGLVAGTPLYMAPEQARGEALDHRADLFSLGSVLYVMCTGRPPFRATGTLAILKRVCEDTPRPIREIIPEAPAWLCDLIARLHAKKPAERFQSARDVVELLLRYQAELAAHGNVAPAPVGAARPRRSRAVLRTALLAAVPLAVVTIVLLAMLVGGLIWWPAAGPGDAANTAVSPPQTPVTPDGAVTVLDGSAARLPRPGRTSWFAQDRQGRWLAVPLENEVVLFDARRMAIDKTLSEAPGRVYAVSFSPDGKRLAAGCWADEDSVVVWDVANGTADLRLPLRGSCKAIHFSPVGDRLLTVGEDTTPILWDAHTGREVRRFAAYGQPVWPDAIFAGDGKYVVTHERGWVKVWDAQSGAEVAARPGPEPADADLPDARHLALALSPDGRLLAAGCETAFTVWATADWSEQTRMPAPATWLAFASDGRSLWTGAHGCPDWQWHAVTRWDTAGGRQLGGAKLNSRGPWAVYQLSVDGRTLYAMACDPAEPFVHVYDTDTGRERNLTKP